MYIFHSVIWMVTFTYRLPANGNGVMALGHFAFGSVIRQIGKIDKIAN